MGARVDYSSTGEGARRERRRTTRAASSMWELRCATDDHELASDATAPRMRTLNAHVGRQVWTYVEDDDAEGGGDDDDDDDEDGVGDDACVSGRDASRAGRYARDVREDARRDKHARDAFARARYGETRKERSRGEDDAAERE